MPCNPFVMGPLPEPSREEIVRRASEWAHEINEKAARQKQPRVEKIQDHHLSDAPALRVTRRKARRTGQRRIVAPRITIRCGCCIAKLEIRPDADPTGRPTDKLEINGVNGTIDQWRQVLLPLLGMHYQPQPFGGPHKI